jgi:hypothetical protein
MAVPLKIGEWDDNTLLLLESNLFSQGWQELWEWGN